MLRHKSFDTGIVFPSDCISYSLSDNLHLQAKSLLLFQNNPVLAAHPPNLCKLALHNSKPPVNAVHPFFLYNNAIQAVSSCLKYVVFMLSSSVFNRAIALSGCMLAKLSAIISDCG